MKWFDQSDARMFAKAGVLMLTGATVLVGSAAALGAAFRVFHLMAGG